MGNGLFVHGGVTDAQKARLALAGLLALQGTGLDVRTGVLHGPGTSTLITGTAATAPMTVQVAAHDAILSRGVANGPYLMPTETVQTVNIAAAPGSGTRVDVVYEKQQDNTAGVPTPDAAAPTPIYGVVQGTVGAGKPALTIVGALELGTVTVSAGATATNGANVTIANTARQTVPRGAPIPVTSAAERDALTQFDGLIVNRLDLDRLERSNGTTWSTVGGDVTLGNADINADLILGTGPAWNDIVTVTATSKGGLCTARFAVSLFNGASGADRTAVLRVVCDATELRITPTIQLPLAGIPSRTRVGAPSSTPSAGTHTWKIQGQASAASSVIVESALLTIEER